MFKRQFTALLLAAILAVNVLAATFTRQPTANESPDTSGQGGTAVEVPSNTGHAATQSLGGENVTVNRTCRWSGFQNGISGVKVSIVLSVDWSENGAVSGGGSSSFRVQYSTNNGSTWTDLFDHTNVSAANSGTATATLPNNTNITQVQVRDRIFATGTAGQSADVTGTVSNITLTVKTQDAHVIVMMD